jgi:hypothetical protein
MTYACSIWELAADSQPLKFQRQQNKVLRTTGNLIRPIQTRNLHVAFKTPYLHDFATTLWRKQASGTRKSWKCKRNIDQGEI